jgi:hypothetical protein
VEEAGLPDLLTLCLQTIKRSHQNVNSKLDDLHHSMCNDESQQNVWKGKMSKQNLVIELECLLNTLAMLNQYTYLHYYKKHGLRLIQTIPTVKLPASSNSPRSSRV